ncbi:MAG: hypothetical protein IJY14_03890 [Acholeplasmatales bacterium]|nr:hypothetical protein [Acholeplasmatales bacterium]
MKKGLVFIFLLIFSFVLVSCGKEEAKDDYKLSVVSPSGAPGIAIADMATNRADRYEFSLNKTPDVLSATFLANEEDVIIAPINMGATMYNKKGQYVLASVLTWGNLYIASRIDNFTLDMIDDGNEVIFFGSGTINQYIVNKVLAYNNVTPENITFLDSTQLTQAQLIAKDNVIVLIAEPALSVAKTKVSDITAISVQDLYAEMSGGSSYPQAGCFIRKETINNHKSVVDDFINDLEASANNTSINVEEVAGYAEALEMGGKKPILINAIPNCNIEFKSASNAKTQIEALFSDAQALTYCGGKLPDEGFYYQK